MFHFKGPNDPYVIVGIDPGTDTLGVSTLEVYLPEGRIHWRDAMTFHGSQMIANRRSLESVHGSRFARLDALEEALTGYFIRQAPHAVYSESPYMNRRFPASFAALTECLTSIRRGLIAYNAIMPLHTVDPASAKANLKVSGKSGDKLLVQNAVLRLQLPHDRSLVPEGLDEHSFDATAIALYGVHERFGVSMIP